MKIIKTKLKLNHFIWIATQFHFYMLILYLIFIALANCEPDQRVKLSDIEVLTLIKDKFTTGRRSVPIEQLRCIGSYYKCNLYAPTVVQCYNRGFDGNDLNWECKAELDKRVKFGEVKVDCEGYDHPNDIFVLNGSCGLRYTLESTKLFKNYDYYNKDLYETSKLSNFLTLIIMIVIISAIYKSCNKHRDLDVRRDINGTFAHIVDSHEPSNLSPNTGFPPPPPPYAFITSATTPATTTTTSTSMPTSNTVNSANNSNQQHMEQSQTTNFLKPESNLDNNNNTSSTSATSFTHQWGPFLAGGSVTGSAVYLATRSSGSNLASTQSGSQLQTRSNRRSESPPPAYDEPLVSNPNRFNNNSETYASTGFASTSRR